LKQTRLTNEVLYTVVVEYTNCNQVCESGVEVPLQE